MFGILGHTLRGCVDWNNHSYLLLIFPNVTPCVGVWIETVMDKGTVITEKVTPCVGVWIETIMHPRQTGQGIVTPCVGVWIETIIVIYFWFFQTSHPAWVCGLKP